MVSIALSSFLSIKAKSFLNISDLFALKSAERSLHSGILGTGAVVAGAGFGLDVFVASGGEVLIKPEDLEVLSDDAGFVSDCTYFAVVVESFSDDTLVLVAVDSYFG